MATTIPVGTGRLILGNNLSEIIDGTFFNDTIYGYAGNDSINGFAGNDYIDGGIGNDTLMGGPGNNTLVGGAGNDFLDGSLGTNDVIFGGAGFDTALYSSLAGFNTAAANGVENPFLVNIVGTAGPDNLVGTPFNDTIVGGAGADVINGAGGNDSIVGGTGADILTGGAGTNTFVYTGILDAGDTITDFFPPLNDRLNLSASGFGGVNPLVLNTNLFIGSFGNLVGTSFGAGAIGPSFAYSDAGGVVPGSVYFDSDGGGPATVQLLLTLTGAPVLTAANFVLIA